MENLLFSVDTVLPLALLMGLGVLLRRLGLLGDALREGLSRLLFDVFFPCMIFTSLASCRLREVFDLRLSVFITAFVAGAAALLTLTVPLFLRDRAKAASFVQASIRNNYMVEGMTLLSFLYGEAGTAVGAVMLPFAMLADNIAAVAIFAVLTPGHRSGGARATLLDFVRNPLIIATLLGFAFSAAGLSLPQGLQTAMSSAGALGPSLALILTGGGLRFASLRKGLRHSIPACALKLLALPALGVGIGLLMGLRGADMAAVYLFTGCCGAFPGPALAENSGGDAALAEEALGLSLLLSVFTLTLGIFLLRSFSLI